MKRSQYHCHCIFLLIFFVLEGLRCFFVEATEYLEAITKDDDSAVLAVRDLTQNTASFSKPASYRNDQAFESMPDEDPSDMDDDLTTLKYLYPQSMSKVTKALGTPKRKLKKGGGGGKKDKDDGDGKASKKGQSSQDDEGTKSGFFDASTVGRQSIPADAPIESTSRLVPLPTPADDNIFDRRRSPTYINNRPNFRPPNMGPSLYPRTTNPTPSLQGPRPSFPTHRIPSGAPKPSMINTPVPTSEVTESFYPTDSSTYAGTLEYTTLPPSFSPAPST